jgi:hypothetical protein
LGAMPRIVSFSHERCLTAHTKNVLHGHGCRWLWS